VLTMHDSHQVIHEVLRSGARGLVLKSDADRTLVSAVDTVAEKRHFFTQCVSEVVMGGYRNHSRTAKPATKSVDLHLTGREEEVLRLLAKGLTSKEVARLLEISTRTVESHRININRKFGFGSIADLVRYAMGNGLVS
jgi:DNA-binding NarL/FixJ family response regulator